MPDKSKDPFQFWEELKRRRVIRVIIGYLAAAYVILELTSILVEPWGLPDWTINFISILLIIGLVVAIIISWIFDVTPEGIKKTESAKIAKQKETPSMPQKRKPGVSDLIIVVLLIVVGILVYPKIFKKDKFEAVRDADGRISVAVMPFQNMTNDTLWDIWQSGIQNELITNLSNSKELSVRQFQTMYDILEGANSPYYASITPSFASDISSKLEANTFILGSIKASGDKFRVNSQLIKTETEEIYKTFQIDGKLEEDIFTITDSLSNLIRNYLQIELMAKNSSYEIKAWATTKNPEAYRYFLKGLEQHYAREWEQAIELFTEGSKIDSSMLMQYNYLIAAYINNQQPEKARLIFNKLYEDKDDKDLSYIDQLSIKYWKADFDKNKTECIKILILILEQDPQQRVYWYQLGNEYNKTRQYEKAIPAFEKVFELDRQWGDTLEGLPTYTQLGRAYHEVGNHKREKEVYELGLKIFPEEVEIIYRQAVCALSQGDTIEANGYIEKYKSILQIYGRGEDYINYRIGWIYQGAEQYDKAINIYNVFIAKNPQNPWPKNRLGYMLIDNEIDVNEGMQLINQALELEPDNSTFLTTKGWGLYKQGKLEESLTVLRESWEEIPFYNHDHHLHIQEVEKAIANQNR